jgi:hypothetical protein
MTCKPTPRAVQSSRLARAGLFALLYLALFAFVLFNSFQYVLPGEPGYDPVSGRRIERFGIALNVLALPFLTLVYLLPGIPNAFPGPVSLIAVAANSLLWGYGMDLLFRRLTKVAKGEKPWTEDGKHG